MKTLSSAIFAVILMTGTAQAQHANFGVKGGLNVSNIHNNNSISYNPVTGLHAGGLVHIHMNKHFAIQPELFYSTSGASYRNFPNDTKLNMGYINAPVLFQYMFLNGLRLQAGPQVGILVHAKSKSGNVKDDFKNDLNSVDFGVATGASYQIPKSGLGFDARFNLGLTDINKNRSFKSTNNTFQAGVFYLFNNK